MTADQFAAQDRIEIPDRCSVIKHRGRYGLCQTQVNGDRVALVRSNPVTMRIDGKALLGALLDDRLDLGSGDGEA